MFKKILQNLRLAEKGQGLVEYALILVLVAIVVIASLLLLGPTVAQAYCRVVGALQPGSCGVITTVSANRTGGGNGNDVVVTITVSTSTSITVSDSQSGQTGGTTCASSCSVTLAGVGNNAGAITVIATAGGSLSASYPAKL
jgi:pilus assembly protein Flp/PilA